LIMEWFREQRDAGSGEAKPGAPQLGAEAGGASFTSEAGVDSPAPVEPEPTAEELASVIAIVLVSDTDETELSRRLATNAARTQLLIGRLRQREVIRDSGGGFFQSSQLVCAGACERRGDLFRGEAVVIQRSNLAWWCAPCWSSRPTEAR
jgi:hypothetical protein